MCLRKTEFPYFAFGFIVFLLILLYSAYTSYEKKNRKQKALTVKPSNVINIIIESEIGNVSQTALTVAKLLDQADSPLHVRVHVIEPVTSIKAYDDMTPSIQRESQIQTRYGHWFQEQILLTKVHQSRGLKGPTAINHILDKTISIDTHDWVLYWPSRLHPLRGWDTILKEHFPLLNPLSFLSFAVPKAEKTTTSSDAQNYIESWFGTDTKLKAGFFSIDANLNLKISSMHREGITKSIGISMNWPILAQSLALNSFALKCIQYGVFDEELALTFLAGSELFISGKLICTGKTIRKVANRRHQITILKNVLSQHSEEEQDAFLENMALSESDDDFIVFARGLLGVTHNYSLQEILIKYGSEAAFETEKEALKYG